MMTRSVNITNLAYAALFAAAALAVLSVKGEWSGCKPALDTLAVMSVQVIGYALTRRFSLISFAFSFIPALPLLAFFLTGHAAWLILCGSLLAAVAVIYNLRHKALPNSRFSTQKWLAALILSEVMLVVVIMLICC